MLEGINRIEASYSRSKTYMMNLITKIFDKIHQLLKFPIKQADLTDRCSGTSDDFSDYLDNLQDYEERLARGEIKW